MGRKAGPAFGAGRATRALLPESRALLDPIAVVQRLQEGDDVVDLGGNVAEWARDTWARPTDAYWSPVRPMVDPLNTEPNAIDGDAHAVRGGDWASTVLTTRAGFRRRRPTAEVSPLTGFRCARTSPPK